MTLLYDSRRGVPQLVLMLAVIAVFGRGLSAGYLQWDDNVFILENRWLDLPWQEFLSQAFGNFFFGDYIPVSLMSYWAEVQVFGRSAEFQHAVNIGLHSANVLLLHRILGKLGFSGAVAFILAMVFAVHPLQSEVVLWISERKSLLAVFFALWTFYFFLKMGEGRFRGTWWGLMNLTFLLSLLSKATALGLPLILVFLSIFRSRERAGSALVKTSILLMLSGIFAWIRLQAYGQSVNQFESFALQPERLLILPLQILAALGFYFRAMILPWPQSVIYPSFGFGSDWMGEIILAAVILFFLIRLCWRRKDWQLNFFVLTSFVFLIPILQIVPRINFVSDRYMYIPVIGFAGIAVIAWPGVFQKKWLSGWLGIWAVMAFLRGEVWMNNERLWTDTVVKNPTSGLARSNLALEHLIQKKHAQAVEGFEQAARLGKKDGTSHLAYHNLGLIYSSADSGELKDLNRAESYFLKAIQFAPQDSQATSYNLALVYIEKQNPEKALGLLQELSAQLEMSADKRFDYLRPSVLALISKIKSGN